MKNLTWLVWMSAACTDKDDGAPTTGTDTDADADTDADTDSDTDSDTDTDPVPGDEDGDGWPGTEDCDDDDPTVLGLVTVDGAPFGTLTDALAAATSGATIAVCAGTHTGPFEATVPVGLVSLDGSALTVLSGD